MAKAIATKAATASHSLGSVPLATGRSGTWETDMPTLASWLGVAERVKPWATGLSGAFALHPLALQLARAADRGGGLASALLGRLLVMTAQLHLAIDALTLQLLLERAQRLVDIIVANDDLHKSRL